MRRRRVHDPGAFAARLVLERPVETPDGQGGVMRTFEPLGAVWARIEPVTALARETAGSQRMTVTHRIHLRARDDLRAAMRFRKGGRLFSIHTVFDPDESGRYRVCDCEEEKP